VREGIPTAKQGLSITISFLQGPGLEERSNPQETGNLQYKTDALQGASVAKGGSRLFGFDADGLRPDRFGFWQGDGQDAMLKIRLGFLGLDVDGERDGTLK